VHNCAIEGERYGFSRELAEKMHLLRKFDATCATYHQIRKRGIRVVVGGDYGFSITPMGQNARDIGHFVKYFGYTPAEALRCATKIGAALMGHEGELGVIKEGALADLLLVDGNPLTDQSVLVGPSRFAMIMKDGGMWRDPRNYQPQARQVAAE
jgi:imidazolonepropionase-like amidohydrolase